jgi:hypothetical protein
MLNKFDVVTIGMALIIGGCIKFGLYGEGAFIFCACLFTLLIPVEYEYEDPPEDEPK